MITRLFIEHFQEGLFLVQLTVMKSKELTDSMFQTLRLLYRHVDDLGQLIFLRGVHLALKPCRRFIAVLMILVN